MRVAVAASDLPHPEGTAAGRDLWAWCEGLRALGHDVEAWVMYRSPLSPDGPLPTWAHDAPVALGSMWRAHVHALALPRDEARRAVWQPHPDAVAVADHIPSIGAVLGRPRSVVTLHYRAMADARSVGRVRPADVQAARAERRAARRAELVLAYSARVGRGLAKPAHVVPIAYPVPAEALPAVEEPTAALLADWTWSPNGRALARLLELWPGVRRRVPGATLLLAGRGLDPGAVGTLPGVEVLGPVGASVEVLGRAAVVAFPCPSSSGPKVKTLEALAHGIPVVTTPAGMEGIDLGDAELSGLVAPWEGLGDRLAELLLDPAERAALGGSARTAVAAHHSPEAAARARVEAWQAAFGVS